MIVELNQFRNITYDYKNDDDVFIGRGLHLNTLTDKINEIIGIVNDETDGSILVDTITELTPGAGVTIGPNVVITGTLGVGGDTTLSAPLIVDDDATVVGRTTTGLLTVTGAATFDAFVYLETDKKIVFDSDGDSFSFITTDAANAFGHGANSLIVSSLGGKVVLYDGDNLAPAAAEMLSIKLGTGATVDNIETTTTDDDTHLSTSGAVVDYVAAQRPDTGSVQYQVPVSNGAGDFNYNTFLKMDYSSSPFLQVGSVADAIIKINAGDASNDARTEYQQVNTTVAVSGWDESANKYSIHVGTAFVATNHLGIDASGNVLLSSMVGTGTRFVVTSAAGVLSSVANTGTAEYYIAIGDGSGGFTYSSFFQYDNTSSAQLTIAGPDNTMVQIRGADGNADAGIKYQQSTTTVAVAGWDESNSAFAITVGTGFVASNGFEVSVSGVKMSSLAGGGDQYVYADNNGNLIAGAAYP